MVQRARRARAGPRLRLRASSTSTGARPPHACCASWPRTRTSATSRWRAAPARCCARSAPEVLHWVEPPPQEVGARRYLSGLRPHTKGRDAAAISHHYDVSNRFYEWVLGPSMAYTCAVYPTDDATLEQAQDGEVRPRLPQARAAARHAAARRRLRLGRHGDARRAHYGVDVVAVTLSRAAGRVGAEGGRRARGCPAQVDIRVTATTAT